MCMDVFSLTPINIGPLMSVDEFSPTLINIGPLMCVYVFNKHWSLHVCGYA